MLGFDSPTIYESSKCYFTYGRMAHLQPDQIPIKSKPWSRMTKTDFVRHINIVLPEDHSEAVQNALAKVVPSTYFKVTMTLGQVLQGDFFTEYIKIGNVLMLSQGRPTIDNVFTLREGQLVMYLDNETYERAGLVGKLQSCKGNRSVQPRWIVTFDLRSPAMVRGKKGFGRLVYACKNALDKPVQWLFYNTASAVPSPDPLLAFSPVKMSTFSTVRRDKAIKMPSLSPPPQLLADEEKPAFEAFAAEIYEWLSLVRLQSPRVSAQDTMDPYLSRYQVPESLEDPADADMCTSTWTGFFPAQIVSEVLASIISTLPARAWFSLSSTAVPTGHFGEAAECTLLRLPDSHHEYLMWEVRAAG